MKVNQFEPFIGEEEYKAIKECFDNNWITEGPKTKELSQKLLSFMDAKYGVFAPNGTLALYLGLRALEIGRGDEVIVPNFTFIASANSIEMCGAKPVFADISLKDLHLDLDHCEKLVTEKTKAIMVVHIFGTCANMDDIINFAKKYNLKVIEDAAQGIGVKWQDKHSGTFGDVGCFSFFADKTITMGEGGFVVTNNKKTYEKLLHLRNQGRLNRGSFIHPQIGYNFRITDIQSAVCLAQFKKLDQIIGKKLNLLSLYESRLKDVKEISILKATTGSNHVPFRVVIMSQFMIDGLVDCFKQKNIEVRNVFYPLHLQPCFDEKYNDKDYKNSIHAYKHYLCLPSYPTLSEEKVDYVCDVIKQYYSPWEVIESDGQIAYYNKNTKELHNILGDKI